MRKLLVFNVIMFLLLYACFECRIRMVEQTMSSLSTLSSYQADATTVLLKQVQKLQRKNKLGGL